ncbi:MAG: Ribosomal protein L11 methyltransferase [Bacteroidia bacterium]|nr:Ribosomal protein L11 methyltransferase [Bacteroidia bacterium]
MKSLNSYFTALDYVQLFCKITPIEPGVDIVTAQLADIDFESFEETDQGLNAYMPSHFFDEEKVKHVLDSLENIEVEYHYKLIPAQNWNAVWESNFEPVIIDGRCSVRAPFHPKPEGMDFDLVIEPKMSFGTAHHETTSLMISYLLQTDVKGKDVLDMGCGTAVLAILAGMKGAKNITAIDIDEWPVENAKENARNNNMQLIEVIMGGAEHLGNKMFDVILANINRNVLLADMASYSNVLNKNGTLFLSGFYKEDLEQITNTAFENGLEFVSFETKNNWTAAQYLKK